jgi:aspartate carbamoyltransferase catalytic subunit
MNFNLAFYATAALAGIAVVYLITTLRKASAYNMPFFKALNPNYTARVHELAQVKASLQPIITEMETRQMSSFILLWKAKFEKGTFSEQDVKELKQQIADGNKAQVDGILSLHPNARSRFNEINAELEAATKAAELQQAEAETELA